MTNLVQTMPFLREQRQFPTDDVKRLSTQMDLAYIDIANKVNDRTIGIFGVNFPAITGESWYLSGSSQKQQTLRQIYSFGAIAAGTELDIPTGITTGITTFTRIYGIVITTNGSSGLPDYRPLPYVDPVLVTTSMTILVGQIAGIQQIRIVLGATAVPVTSGIAVLEWLSPF